MSIEKTRTGKIVTEIGPNTYSLLTFCSGSAKSWDFGGNCEKNLAVCNGTPNFSSK